MEPGLKRYSSTMENAVNTEEAKAVTIVRIENFSIQLISPRKKKLGRGGGGGGGGGGLNTAGVLSSPCH